LAIVAQLFVISSTDLRALCPVTAVAICCRIQVWWIQHRHDTKHGRHAWRILTYLLTYLVAVTLQFRDNLCCWMLDDNDHYHHIYFMVTRKARAHWTGYQKTAKQQKENCKYQKYKK